MVEAFSGEVRQVLLNLTRNAAEATPNLGASIRVALTCTRSEVEILVADHGEGIDPGLLPTLLDSGKAPREITVTAWDCGR